MVALEKIEIPIHEFLCENCRRDDSDEVKDVPSLYSLLEISLPGLGEDSMSVSVDLESIEWKKLGTGYFAAQARVRILCPCCESPKSLSYHLRASKLVLSAAGTCSTCGLALALEGEEISYDGLNSRGPLVLARGTFVCRSCLAEQAPKVDVSVPARVFFEGTGKVELRVGPEGSSVNKIDEEPVERNLLVVISNSDKSQELRLTNECRAIEQSLERGTERLESKVIHAATIDDWARAMLDREYHIIHFSGHGTEHGLMLEAESGEPRPVSPQALGGMLNAYRSIECVILNACFSEANIEPLLTTVPYAIVMTDSIYDDSAVEFSRGFYDALSAGKSIEFAFNEGCRRIELKSLPDGEVPRLYIRGAKALRQGRQQGAELGLRLQNLAVELP